MIHKVIMPVMSSFQQGITFLTNLLVKNILQDCRHVAGNEVDSTLPRFQGVLPR